MTTETVGAVVLEQLKTAETPAAAPPSNANEKPAAEVATPAVAAETPAVDPAKVEKNFPDDWREKMSKGDEAKLKRLQRYASPEALAEAKFAQDEKISKVGFRESAPEDAEALKRWRADNGIPESPDKYDLTLKDGLVLGELDKPLVDNFLKIAHSKNVAPDVVNEVVNWYYGQAQEQAQQFAVQEAAQRQEAEKELIAEWGNNFTVEKNSINNFLKSTGMEELQYARMPDGSALGNNPAMLRKLSALAREINPGATVVPGAANAAATIDSELAAIEKKMGTTEYTNDRGMQARYMELVTAKEKMQARQR